MLPAEVVEGDVVVDVEEEEAEAEEEEVEEEEEDSEEEEVVEEAFGGEDIKNRTTIIFLLSYRIIYRGEKQERKS